MRERGGRGERRERGWREGERMERGGREEGERATVTDLERLTCPASRENLPPPTMSVTGGKEPRGMLSTVVPTASPTARPNKLPRNLSLRSIDVAMAKGENSGVVRVLVGGVITTRIKLCACVIVSVYYTAT